MRHGMTIDDLLGEVNMDAEEEKEYLHLVEEARRRKEVLNRELASGRRAAQDLSRSICSLGETLHHLAVELEQSAGRATASRHTSGDGRPPEGSLPARRPFSDN